MVVSESGEGPGNALRGAREALNVSEREVADALNLPLSVIEAMEANDYEQLPPAVFTRGYLRSYARLLELDPDDVVASFPVSEEDSITSLTGEVAVANVPNPLADRRVQMIGAAIIAVLVLIVLVVSLSSPSDEAAEQPSAPDSTATPVADVVTPQPGQAQNPASEPPAELGPDAAGGAGGAAGAAGAGDAAELSNASEAAADIARETATTDPQSTSQSPRSPLDSAAGAPVAEEADVVEEADAVEQAEVVTAPTPAGMRRLTPFGDDVLTMTFAEDCWVDIKDREGTRLYGDLIRGGRTIALIGDAPFRLLLGYAPGAQVSFNGAVVDVESQTRNNVARLTVGN